MDYSRQLIELPPPPPVKASEHQVVKRWCPHCAARRSPALDLSQQVFGQGRIGLGIAGLVSYLRTAWRMTIRHVQAYVPTVHGLWLNTGEGAELTHRVRTASDRTMDGLKEQIRHGPVIHRKINGGTHSDKGTKTRLGLATVRHLAYAWPESVH